MELDSIITTIASGAMNALLRNEVTQGRISTPKLNWPKTCTPPKVPKKFRLNAAIDKVNALRDSDVSSLNTKSDSHLLFSLQE